MGSSLFTGYIFQIVEREHSLNNMFHILYEKILPNSETSKAEGPESTKSGCPYRPQRSSTVNIQNHKSVGFPVLVMEIGGDPLIKGR